MTTRADLDAVLEVALALTASSGADDRYARLIDAVAAAIPCDAVAVLRADGETLIPLVTRGLAPDVAGRRFPRAEHPRLDAICRSDAPVLFPPDSPLPDPWDGLIEGARELDHHVHSCLGSALRVDGALVGALTLDALDARAFDHVDPRFVTALAALAGAVLRTNRLIDALEQRAQHHGLVTRDFVRDGLERGGGLLVGTSPELARLRREIELVGRSDFPVLVTGETGVGKELVVRMLHRASARADRPLVYVNCAALPETIVESELFGHERGAFTGADSPRAGKFQVADGAGLFLDEVAELPLQVQPKLLRALQEGEIQRVGSDRTTHVNVRLFAATNREVEQEMKAGRLRPDLVHRLDVCRIHVPALRERRGDIPALTGHFADRARRQLGIGPVRLAADAQAALARAPWPGNVRELENVLSRAILHASARTEPGRPVFVREEDLGLDGAGTAEPSDLSPPRAPRGTRKKLREAVRDHQRLLVQEALREAAGSWAAAARALGMHRSNLHHLAERLGIKETVAGAARRRRSEAAPRPRGGSGRGTARR